LALEHFARATVIARPLATADFALPMKRSIVDAHVQAMAVQAGLLKPGEPVTPEVRTLVDLVAQHCAQIAQGHNPTEERGPEMEIRSAFGLLS
jgi:hypothetical protein